ncbi:hypothetical protein SGQ83_00015 [Flavobacterium sp. Fl-318]|uniref:GLPGLI family protein n=1 Tax=Flavobacterium cupriresistens TaxID=2893885 RepID=A0ABU4R694_9FLAO|nr:MULTISPECIES: hypothetical protein [unclassified Flavobacterium]MDX6187721.1 hypothetical protein [Flavobacterium sp. Fl-318]UFH42356.1 hypothetical protein LNP23_21435 [Flavobacterium sp. F-323]
MFQRILLTTSLLLIGTIGHCQTVNEVLQQMGKQYSAARPFQYHSEYTLYKNAESKKIEQSYKGIFMKNAANEIYLKIDQTEILNSKTVNIKISHPEKAILLSDPIRNYFGSLDIKPLLEFCEIESFKDCKTYWEITLTAKNYSSLPYSRIIIQVSRKFFLQKSIFYYSSTVNFSKDYRMPKPSYPRLEVTNTNFSRKAVNATLFTSPYYFTSCGKNICVLASRLKQYQVIDQRNISNK